MEGAFHIILQYFKLFSILFRLDSTLNHINSLYINFVNCRKFNLIHEFSIDLGFLKKTVRRRIKSSDTTEK